MKAFLKALLVLGLLGLVASPAAVGQDASEQPAEEVELQQDESEGSDPLNVKPEPGSDGGSQSVHDDGPEVDASLIECDCDTNRLRTTGAPCSCEKLFQEAVKNASKPQQGFPGGPVPQSPESNLLPPRGPAGLSGRQGIPHRRRLGLGFGFGRGYWGGGYYPGYGYGYGYPGYGWGYPGYGYGWGYPGYGFGIYF
ncbi:hypothetical protein CSUI_006731 [Cystoisospora suis]|uniref:Uncharacterized protein n=1 Tax=Cystoisospora suis TaxID=483139 RepID=A0A2C6KSI5_9APIC|nr:hypothetical protein CSUI_006731 [Cystoisospora suis]